jgi:WhiB family transcriptional regulator, redox-sensing transcriptional regulator
VVATLSASAPAAAPPAGWSGERIAAVPDSWRTGHDRAVDWLGSVGAFWSWRERARCQDVDSSLFFAPDGERGAPRRRREQRAKAVCVHCEVRDFCADYALANHETYGIWGGLTETERERIWASDGQPSGEDWDEEPV